MTPHTVLLVPHEGDPLGLLAERSCGATPPIASLARVNLAPNTPERWLAGSAWPNRGRALGLAWDGGVVPGGVFRLWYCLDEHHLGIHDGDAGAAILLAIGVESVEELLECVAPWVQSSDAGTLLVLDADGREVTP